MKNLGSFSPLAKILGAPSHKKLGLTIPLFSQVQSPGFPKFPPSIPSHCTENVILCIQARKMRMVSRELPKLLISLLRRK